MRSPQIFYSKQFRLRELDPQRCLLIFDRKLIRHPSAQKIIRRFPFRYGVVAGEKLKSAENFLPHLLKMDRLIGPRDQKDFGIVALGGGSVGDFAGFFASIYKRGRPLSFIPSTWLAAIDSSHGGKNGLNLAGAKNQIGTFYPAEKIFIIRDLLKSQSPARVHDAAGELLKIAFIQGGALWKSGVRQKSLNEKDLWRRLPAAVAAKYRVVNNDPLEKGPRQILNLGHTVGHVIEAALGQSHGRSVGQGLVFALLFSAEKNYLKKFPQLPLLKSFEKDLRASLQKINSRGLRQLLTKDKKKTQSNKLNFVFVRKPGDCFRAEVAVSEVVSFFEKLRGS